MLAGIVRVFRDMRRGVYDEQELEAQLQARGLMYRFFGRMMRSIDHTWQLFFVGFVFGIGFDTATEVLLLAGTAAAAPQGLPWYAVLTLPLLFSGGMMLCDSVDGLFMNFAYGWAFSRPVRKVYYNITITALSIGVAFLVGGIEIVGRALHRAAPARLAGRLPGRLQPEHRRLPGRGAVRARVGLRADDLAVRQGRGALGGGRGAER